MFRAASAGVIRKSLTIFTPAAGVRVAMPAPFLDRGA